MGRLERDDFNRSLNESVGVDCEYKREHVCMLQALWNIMTRVIQYILHKSWDFTRRYLNNVIFSRVPSISHPWRSWSNVAYLLVFPCDLIAVDWLKGWKMIQFSSFTMSAFQSINCYQITVPSCFYPKMPKGLAQWRRTCRICPPAGGESQKPCGGFRLWGTEMWNW